MGIFAGPEVIEDGLVLALDAANLKGYDKYENLILNSTNLYNACFETTGSGTDGDGTYVTYQDGGNRGYLGSIAPTGETSVRLKTPANYGGYSKQRTFFNINFPASTQGTASIFYKNDPTNPIPNIRIWGQNTNGPSQGNIITINLTNSPGVSYGNGWYRLSVNLGTSPSTNNFNFFSLLLDSNYSNNRYCEFAGFQVERGSSVTDYYATTSTAKTRGTTWTDLSLGGGNNGTLVNGPTYNSSNRGSIVFDGVNDYITVSNVQPNTNDFTISVWVYKFNNTSNDYIWDFGSNGGTLSAGTSVGGYGFRYYNGTLGTSSNMYTQGTIPDINKWYNVSITRNSGISTMYVNGSLVTSSSGDTHNISSTTLYIGRYGGGTGYEHHGYISNFNIYNRALTATEIQKNFNAQRGRFGI